MKSALESTGTNDPGFLDMNTSKLNEVAPLSFLAVFFNVGVIINLLEVLKLVCRSQISLKIASQYDW